MYKKNSWKIWARTSGEELFLEIRKERGGLNIEILADVFFDGP